MEPYQNRHGNSSVAGFETGPDFIRVQFTTGAIYLYTYASCGPEDCETMKSLALAGEGLAAFIRSVVKKRYARREQ